MKEKNMRQAGLKPKNHSSGVYWVRASSGNGGTKQEVNDNEDLGVFGILIFLIGLPFVLLIAAASRLTDLFSGRE